MRVRRALFQDTISLAAMSDALSRSPDYQVLRRLVPRLLTPSVGQDTRTAVLLDTEIYFSISALIRAAIASTGNGFVITDIPGPR
jgi:DNA polymerase-3 subunit epsilon